MTPDQSGHLPAHEQLEQHSRTQPHTQSSTSVAVAPNITPRRRTRERTTSSASSHPGAPFNTPYSSISIAGDAAFDHAVELRRVSDSLEGIRELHNDMVDCECYPPPNPPKSTPYHTPPASHGVPQVLLPHIRERLENESLPGHISPPGTASSVTPVSEGLGDEEHGTIRIGLGSSRNPSVEEQVRYMTYIPRPTLHQTSSSMYVGIDGVKEYTDWSDQIEAEAEFVMKRLENLAMDDWQRNAGKTAAEHFTDRIRRLLNSKERKYRVGDIGITLDQENVIATDRDELERAFYVTSWEFERLKERFDASLTFNESFVLALRDKIDAETVENLLLELERIRNMPQKAYENGGIAYNTET